MDPAFAGSGILGGLPKHTYSTRRASGLGQVLYLEEKRLQQPERRAASFLKESWEGNDERREPGDVQVGYKFSLGERERATR